MMHKQFTIDGLGYFKPSNEPDPSVKVTLEGWIEKTVEEGIYVGDEQTLLTFDFKKEPTRSEQKQLKDLLTKAHKDPEFGPLTRVDQETMLEFIETNKIDCKVGVHYNFIPLSVDTYRDDFQHILIYHTKSKKFSIHYQHRLAMRFMLYGKYNYFYYYLVKGYAI